jgi:hypothetical protein
MSLTPDRSRTLLLEFAEWFGSPALLTKKPSEFTRGDDQHTHILDGRVRFDALRDTALFEWVWRAGKFQHYVFLPSSIECGRMRSTDGHKLLPRMLALAGHYDRAWQYVPECWRDSFLSVEAFLNLPRLEALSVWACRHRERRRLLKSSYQRDYARERHAAKIVNQIRRLFREHDEDGKEFTIDDVQQLVEAEHVDGDSVGRDKRMCVNLSRELLDAIPAHTLRKSAFIRCAVGRTRGDPVADYDWLALKELRRQCEPVTFRMSCLTFNRLQSESQNAGKSVSEIVEAHCWWYLGGQVARE